MATYTSTQNGNWNTDATWGGGGHPSINDDVVNIGHEVTYDAGDSAVTWGNVTINSSGILIFPTDSDSTIVFNATGILIVNSGGELRAGTDGTPIDDAQHCYFQWPQGSSTRNVLVLNDGGTINIYGDPVFYGSERYAYLDSDWTENQTFYITGDFSSKWQSGQKFYIHENIDYDNYQNDGHVYTIDTVGEYDAGNDRTPITISEAAPGITFNTIHNGHTSKLIMLSRNVTLCDPAATWGVYDYYSYTERLRFDNNQATGNNNLNIQDAVFYGWDRAIDGGYNADYINVVFVSNNYGIYYGTNHQIPGDFVSNNYGIYYGTNHQITGDFVSNTYGINSSTNNQITGDLVSNYNGIRYGTNHQITGDFVSNNDGINSGTNHQVTGDLVSNTYGIAYGSNCQVTGDFTSNTTDIYKSLNILINGDVAAAVSLNYTSNSQKNSIIFEDCTINSVRRDLRIYENSGTLLPLVDGDGDWQAPDSGNDWILKLLSNSYCAVGFVTQMELSPLREMAVYCTAASHTITIKIYPSGWTSSLDQDDVYIKARYLAGASGEERTTVQTSSETYANAAWRSCTVSFTTGQAGVVYFNLIFTAYESGDYILIDPIWSVS